MSETAAIDLLTKLREELKSVNIRAVYTIRAAAARGDQPSPKTIEVLAKSIEVGEYAETIMLMLTGVEEDAGNELAMNQIATISMELDKIAVAIRERMNPTKRTPRLDRSGG